VRAVRAIIVADGDVPLPGAIGALLAEHGPADDTLVVAADGGAIKAVALGLWPDVVVGDADSLPSDRIEELRRDGVEVLVHPAQKDESDTELAVREAIDRGAQQILLLGGFGGDRVEHTIANLLLLTLPDLAGRDVVLIDGPSTVRVIGVDGPATLEVRGDAGDYVSLLPLSTRVEGVTTAGLAYPLDGATLEQGPARGLSNELLGSVGSVSIDDGRLAVVHTRRSDAAR
jgi:thiamine pyrophosphokinase